MADEQMTWVETNRDRIDKIKKGGYDAALLQHTKGMLAGETALQAAFELAMEEAGGDMTSRAAIMAGECRIAKLRLQLHHCQTDQKAFEFMGTPIARSGER